MPPKLKHDAYYVDIGPIAIDEMGRSYDIEGAQEVTADINKIPWATPRINVIKCDGIHIYVFI